MPDDPRVREIAVSPHDLGTYDDLVPDSADGEDDDEDNDEGEAGVATIR